MLENDPVVFAAAGSAPIRVWDRDNERAETRNVRRPAECTRSGYWRESRPDYFTARRIRERAEQDRPPEPLRLPPPLNRLPWDIAQDQFGVEGTDFIGILSTVLLRVAQDQFRAYSADNTRLADTLPPKAAQDQIRVVEQFLGVGKMRNEAGVSSTEPPV